MSQLLTDIAEMIGQRDRNLLEVSLADLLFKLLGASRLDLWRVLDHKSGARARLLAGLRTGAPVAVSDPMMDITDWPLVDGMEGVGECWRGGAPLHRESSADGGRAHLYLFPAVSDERGPIGVLAVEVPQPLSDSQLTLIDGLLRVYRSHLALLDYSEHDTLTGLLNRKTYEDIFRTRTAQHAPDDAPGRDIRVIGRRASRPGETLWLAVIDIDFFKKINDRFGHVFGDEVLLLLARLMRSTFRVTDTLFRFGGEEFVVLLGFTDPEGAEIAVERFRAAVEIYRFPQVGAVTVSVGFCRATGEENPTATFEHADEALYWAKKHGRNRCFGYEALTAAGVLQPKATVAGDVELF